MDKVEKVRLEPFNRDQDTGLLAGWLKRPHVARWWGDPDTHIAQPFFTESAFAAETNLFISPDSPGVIYRCAQHN